MSGFDLQAEKAAAVAEDEGTVVHIEDRAGNPMYWGEKEDKPVTITVAGRYSTTYRRVEAEIRKRPFKAKKLTLDKFDREQVEKVAACTLAWAGFFDGKRPFELSRANAEALYMACPWVLDQLTEAMEEPARFSPNSSPTP